MDLLVQDREILPDRRPINRAFADLMHPSMCTLKLAQREQIAQGVPWTLESEDG